MSYPFCCIIRQPSSTNVSSSPYELRESGTSINFSKLELNTLNQPPPNLNPFNSLIPIVDEYSKTSESNLNGS